MTTIGKPKIDNRPERLYVGIRTLAPFKGMSKVVTRISKELDQWLKAEGVETSGPPFLRFHVIDMRGTMDITFGVPVPRPILVDGAVTAGVLPAGRYASLVYSGGGIAGNRALIEWVRGQGLAFDRWDTEQGDNFRSRYETYLTDPKIEPRKTRWQVEVAIKLAD
jgi:hypothetical protein